MSDSGSDRGRENEDGDEYTAAVIGCGSRGREHLAAYEHVDGARPVACAGRSADGREELAGEFGLAAYGDAAEMLASERPDLVHVATPPDARAGVMETVADAGVPACTVEKPIALGVADWRAIGDLDERGDTRFAVCHQFRWDPDLRRCREAVASGALGEPTFLECSARLVLTDQGTHCLHYANSLNGDARIASVFGTASGPFSGGMHPGPDATQALVTFENGVHAQWTTGTAAPAVEGREEAYQHKRAVVHAERGHATWEQFGEWSVVSPDGVERGAFEGMEAWRAQNRRTQAVFHERMLEWIEGGAAPGTRLERSLHEWKAVLALYASTLRNEPVRLDAFAPDDDLVDRVAAALNG